MHALIQRIIHGWVVFWSIIFFIGVFVNFLEIILRICFSYSLDLFYDIPVWCTVWATLLVSGPILLDNEHVSIDAVLLMLRGKTKKAVTIINSIFTLIFGIIFCAGGMLLVIQLYTFKTSYTRSIPVPAWIVESCIPAGLFVFSCCALYNLYKIVVTKEE